jgi:hypothetical protein
MYMSGMWLGVDLTNDILGGGKQKTQKCMLKRDWTTCSNMLTILNQLMSTRIYTLIMNKIFMWTLNIMMQMTTDTFWIC